MPTLLLSSSDDGADILGEFSLEEKLLSAVLGLLQNHTMVSSVVDETMKQSTVDFIRTFA
jgi:hypothetical protein